MPRPPKQVSKETEQAITERLEYRDGALYWKGSGKGQKKSRRAGCLNKQLNRRVVCVNGNIIYEYRVIFWLHHGYWPLYVDHIDHDCTNNRIENLRSVTHAENMRNRVDSVVHNGVYQNGSRFKAVVYLGTYDTPEEASHIVEKAKGILSSFSLS